MSNSLRDQLLGLGFSAPKPEPRPQRDPRKPAGKGGKPVHAGKPGPQQRKPQSREDIDLAKAYAIRAQKEKDERIEAERLKQEEARKRREAKAKLAGLLQGKALNAGIDDADHVRHFEYGGKIKRVHVTAAQLKALNAGELGVVQLDGRYLLVDAATLAQAEAVFAQAIALKVDPDAPVADDPYSDPKFQVPDDLAW
jgi:uncharacterized protein YaiL (DUF2058 family)